MILTNLRPCQVFIPGTAGVRVSWTYVYIFLKTESKWQYFKKNCLENLHIVELSSEIVTVFSSSLFQPVLFPWLPTAEGYDSNLRCLDNRPMWQIKGKTCYHGLFPHVRLERRVIGNQYKVILSDHRYPLVKCFCPDVSALIQHPQGTRAHGMVWWRWKWHAMAFTVIRSQPNSTQEILDWCVTQRTTLPSSKYDLGE